MPQEHPVERPFMTDHQMIQEIRDDVRALAHAFDTFKDEVVLKSELQMWREAQKTTRRWAITTIITVFGLMLTAVWLILAINS